jgi:hypothetical protein
MSDHEYLERSFVVMHSIGKFVVHIKKVFHHRSIKLDYYMVMVGNDPINACVNIRAPFDSDEPLALAYVTSEVACTLDNIMPTKGVVTVQMIQLGITIARELSPRSTYMELDDCSHFMCSTPDGKVRRMALPSFYMAFHGKTWYEDKFGAILKDPVMRTEYEMGIANLDNPESKPAMFRFLNQDITNILSDMYDSCGSWNEFFRKIEKKYGDKKCWAIQPWIETAISHIFGGPIDMKRWIVDLKSVPKLSYCELNETVPMLGDGWDNPITERVMQRASFYTDLNLMSYNMLSELLVV